MKKVIKMIPLIVVSSLILYFSLREPSRQQETIKNIDKVYHFVAYFSLAFSICLSISHKALRTVFFALGAFLGILMEYLQSLLPYRDMSLFDGLANWGGLVSGIILFKLFYKQISRVLEIVKLKNIFLD